MDPNQLSLSLPRIGLSLSTLILLVGSLLCLSSYELSISIYLAPQSWKSFLERWRRQMDGFHLDVADRWAESKPHGSALDHTKLQRCSASTSFANTYQDDSNLPHPGTEGSFRTQSRTGSPSRSSRYATSSGIKYRLSHRLCLAFPVSISTYSSLSFLFKRTMRRRCLIPSCLCGSTTEMTLSTIPRCPRLIFYKSILHSADSFLGHPRKILVSYFLLAVSFVAIRIVPKYHLHLSLCM